MPERSGAPLPAGSCEGEGFGRDDEAWLETDGGKVGATMTR